MPTTIGSHAIATFTSPVNGTTPIDANTVRGNDNTIQTAYNAHDSDPGIHLQSSLLASRPTAGATGRKWMTTDPGAVRLFHDTGSSWEEVAASALSTPRTLWGQAFDGTANVSGALTGVTNITATGTFTFGNGTVGAPALAPNADTNTGIYFPASDTIGFVRNGVEAWRINSSGHFFAAANNTYDIGASAGNRPRNIYTAGDMFVGNVRIGRGADNSDDNVAFGLNAMGVASFSNARNVAIGKNALAAVSSYCTGNTAVGNAALANHSSTSSNTAIGSECMELASGFSCNNNVAVGYQALFYSTNANNVAIGATAGFNLRAASETVAVGAQALQTNQSGVQNTAVGRNALYSTTAGLNTALGYNSGYDISTGQQNVVIGSFTGLGGGVDIRTTNGSVVLSNGSAMVPFWYDGPNQMLRFRPNGTERWQMTNTGALLATTDNSYDIGASGANRARDLYLGRNMVGGGWVRAGGASVGAASTTTIGSTTSSVVGATGAASALPANPLGYIIAHVGTTEVRIPYYNA